MNALQLRYMTMAALLMATPGCRLVEGIFKAGVWAGVIIVVFIALLIFGAMRLFGGGRA